MSLIKVDPTKLAAKKAEEALAARKAAYIEEADPLFFKAQRSEALLSDWHLKIKEIKERFPKE